MSPIQRTNENETLLMQCWSTVCDAGPPLHQRGFNVLTWAQRLLGAGIDISNPSIISSVPACSGIVAVPTRHDTLSHCYSSVAPNPCVLGVVHLAFGFPKVLGANVASPLICTLVEFDISNSWTSPYYVCVTCIIVGHRLM